MHFGGFRNFPSARTCLECFLRICRFVLKIDPKNAEVDQFVQIALCGAYMGSVKLAGNKLVKKFSSLRNIVKRSVSKLANGTSADVGVADHDEEESVLEYCVRADSDLCASECHDIMKEYEGWVEGNNSK